MTERLREQLAALTEGCEPGPFRGVSGPRHNWWLENAAGDSSFPSPDDVALMVNALPDLLDAHDRMAGALDMIESSAHETTAYPHFAPDEGFDEGWNAVRDKWLMVCEAARAALAVPKEENP